MSFYLLKGIVCLFCLLPWRAMQHIGIVLADIWFHLVRIRRQVVLENLQLALPEMASDHKRIAKDSYRNTSISVMELFKMASLGKKDLLDKIILNGFENYKKAHEKGRGVIVVTGHFGNFDLLACSQSAGGVPLAIISKEFRITGLSRLWMQIRESFGLVIFFEGRHAKGVLKWLKKGNVLGIVADQRTSKQRGGILAGFMGREVWTSTWPALLAIRTGAAILPVWSKRRKNGKHDIFIEPEICVQYGSKNMQPTVELTGIINEKLAKWVESYPGNWMWLHKRFNNIGSRNKRKLE